jgi:hypothetical protein
MADTTSTAKKAFRIWEFLDEIILAGALFPLLKSLAAKGVEHFGKKAAEKFGWGDDTGESRKTVDDNILYSWVMQNGLTMAEIVELKGFEVELGATEGGKDKVQALVLFIVKGLVMFKKETTKTSGGGKDGKPKETSKEVDYSNGVAWAVGFLRLLLSIRNFEGRVAFLEHEEVFSLIKRKKETIDMIKVSLDGLKKAADFAKVHGSVVAEKGAAGMDNLIAGSETMLEKVRRWRDNA